jgi:hypothetical protein
MYQLNLYILFRGNLGFNGLNIPASLGEEFVEQQQFNRPTDRQISL